MNNKTKILIVISLFITFTIGWVSSLWYTSTHNSRTINSVRQNSTEFQYINPLLFIDNSNENFSEYRDLESQIKKYIIGKLSKIGREKSRNEEYI